MRAVTPCGTLRGVGGRAALGGFLLAEFVSYTGTRVSMLAIPWFVLTTTGSATQTGLVAAAEMVPLVLLKVLGGPVIDRVGARRVSVLCDAGSVAAIGAVPLLHGAGLLTFPLLLVLVAVAGALRGPGDGAKQALVPVLAEEAGLPLEKVTGLSGAVERTTALLGAAGAGVLVAWVGAAEALLVDAASFAVAAVVLGVATRGLPAPAPDEDPQPYLQRLRTGYDFLRRERLLLTLLAMIAATNMLDAAFAAVLAPVWAKQTGYGAAALGLLFASHSALAIVGSVLAGRWGRAMPRLRVYVVAFLVSGSPRFAALALGAPLWLVLVVSMVGGLGSGFLNPLLGAVMFERIPAPLVGRVTSLIVAAALSLIPVGAVLGGALVSGLGLADALWLCGAAYLVATMAPLFVRAFRGLDERPSPARP